MKIQSIIKSILFMAGFSVMALTGGAQAQVVNVQFAAASGVTMNGTSWSSTVAPLAYTGTVWNNIATGSITSVSNLNYSDGSGSSGISYAETGLAGGQVASPQSTLALMQQAIYSANGGTHSFTLSGLNSSDTYDVAIDAQVFQAGWKLDTTISSSAGGPSQSTNLTNYSSFTGALDGDYVEFDDITGASSVTFTITPGPTTAGGTYWALNGFQVEQVEAPEPSTMALIGLGGLAFLAIRRRHRLV